jgi:hypothetical protein
VSQSIPIKSHLLRIYCAIAARLLPNRFAIAVQSHHNRYLIADLPLRNRCAIAYFQSCPNRFRSLLRIYCAFTARLLRNRFAIAVQSHHNRYLIAVLPLRNCAHSILIKLQSPRNNLHQMITTHLNSLHLTLPQRLTLCYNRYNRYTNPQICDYLFELSQKFNQFYEKCPVMKAGSPELQLSRTKMCELTAGMLALCLKLLNIETVESL